MPIALLLQLASIVPGLLKFAGAGDTATTVATHAVEIAKQISGIADPTAAVEKVVQDPAAQQAFIIAANQQQATWDQLFLNDVANARARDIALSAGGRINWMRFGLVAFSMLTLIILMFFVMRESSIGQYAQGVITLLIGRLAGYLDNIFNFEFGTTRSSQQKDATINKLSTGAGTSATGTGA